MSKHSAQFENENVLEHSGSVSSTSHTVNTTILNMSPDHQVTVRNYRSSSVPSLLDNRSKIVSAARSSNTVRPSLRSKPKIPIPIPGNTVSQQMDLSVQSHVHGGESTVEILHDIQSQTGVDGGIPRVAKREMLPEIQITTTQNRTFHKQRIRSMLDPLPDTPRDSLGIGTPLVKVVNKTRGEDLLEMRHLVNENTAKELNGVGFNFEDGTVLDVNIPSFQDPETSDEVNGENSVSIYSSQILSKFEQTKITRDSVAGKDKLGESNFNKSVYTKFSFSHLYIIIIVYKLQRSVVLLY